jgi:glycosyltransferase involved in cell wall biosynthesis
LKLAFVVQRYGAGIAGGSEAHCRDLAQRLARSHDITVLTTCARDYVSWANELPAGESRDGAVGVLRFPVARTRSLSRFAELSDDVFDGPAPIDRQEAWFRENGPDAPGLLDHLREYGRRYDLVLFWTFRYAPSYFGLPLVADRAVLLPTAEEEPSVYLDAMEGFLAKPAGFIFLTPEEQALVSTSAGRPLEPSTIIGAGIEPALPAAGRDLVAAHGVPDTYVLYLGRVDRNKGCDTLFEYFETYAERVPGVTLALAGPAKMRVPAHPGIRPLGYVSNELRSALLAHARALIVPSPFESLSMVLLEAWNHGVPALVNAHCKVLRGQVRRANGGLHYRSAEEFCEALDVLLTQEHTRTALGRQGLAYVDREYRWPVVLSRVESLLTRVRASRRHAGA